MGLTLGSKVVDTIYFNEASSQLIIKTNTDEVFTIILSSSGGGGTVNTAAPVSGTGDAGTPITVADNAIANSKLIQVPTSTFKGRVTAGIGAVEDLSVAQVLTALGLNSVVADSHTQNTDTGTSGDSFSVGDGTDTNNKVFIANNSDTNKPSIRYNETTNQWQFSNDGVVFTDIGGGGATEVNALDYEYDVGDSLTNPGSFRLKLDNDDPALATNITVNDLNLHGLDVSSLWQGLSTSSRVTLTDKVDSTIQVVYSVSGAVVDNTGFSVIPVTFVSRTGAAGTEWVDATSIKATLETNTGGGSGSTNLGYNAATRTVTSDTGTDAIIPEATTVDAGLMAPSDKTKLDNSIQVTTGVPDANKLVLTGVDGKIDSSLIKNNTIFTRFEYDDGSSATDPGVGRVKFNATFTEMYIDSQNISALDVSALLLTIATNTYFTASVFDNSTKGAFYQITGAPVDNTGFLTIPVIRINQQGGEFLDEEILDLVFFEQVTALSGNDIREDLLFGDEGEFNFVKSYQMPMQFTEISSPGIASVTHSSRVDDGVSAFTDAGSVENVSLSALNTHFASQVAGTWQSVEFTITESFSGIHTLTVIKNIT